MYNPSNSQNWERSRMRSRYSSRGYNGRPMEIDDGLNDNKSGDANHSSLTRSIFGAAGASLTLSAAGRSQMASNTLTPIRGRDGAGAFPNTSSNSAEEKFDVGISSADRALPGLKVPSYIAGNRDRMTSTAAGGGGLNAMGLLNSLAPSASGSNIAGTSPLTKDILGGGTMATAVNGVGRRNRTSSSSRQQGTMAGGERERRRRNKQQPQLEGKSQVLGETISDNDSANSWSSSFGVNASAQGQGSGTASSLAAGGISMSNGNFVPATTLLPQLALTSNAAKQKGHLLHAANNAGTAGTTATLGMLASSSACENPQALPMSFEEHSLASVTSIKGLKPGNPNWTNQDNFFVAERFDGRENFHFYCVLDGHGEHGHIVSRKCREDFPAHLRASQCDIKRAFYLMQSDLCSSDIDVRCSGATCVMLMVNGNKLSVANCGDSRAVLGRRSPNGAITAHPLTNDHKPDKPEERKRILAAGGHLGCRQVLVNQGGRGPVGMPVGPCRVWYQYRGETLGLAMSRSLGDSIVHRSGVSAEPEIIDHTIDEQDEFVIIATDGVWDVVDNNQAAQLVASVVNKAPSSNPKQWNALEATNVLTKFARSRWEKLSPMVDDITCVIVKLNQR